MKTHKQKPDFLNIGIKLLNWYKNNSRDLPWRNTQNPYNIWISEIILQQTQVKQGSNYYLNFIENFPNVQQLHKALIDEVLLYWKGLGYYSRAINLHKASHQIMDDFGGKFPNNYNDLLKLKGVGKYTAAAISSICFNEKIPAIDGNFYRVFSRLFADNYDISQASAFQYFSNLALKIMPEYETGNFNQAIMDLGSEICKPKKPNCEECPINEDCLAYLTNSIMSFPVKTKKVSVKDLSLKYYFVSYQSYFLTKRRGTDLIWKNLYEFPTEIPSNFEKYITKHTQKKHKLTHRNLLIDIFTIELPTQNDFENFASENSFIIVDKEESHQKSFPKALQDFIERNM